MEIKVNAKGQQCPMPLIMAKDAIEKANVGDIVTVEVDNSTSFDNLMKMGAQKGLPTSGQTFDEKLFTVSFTVEEPTEIEPELVVCPTEPQGDTVVVISGDTMGAGDDALGKVLIKAFLFSLTQLDKLPDTLIFYNGGVKLVVEGAETLEDVKKLAAEGVKVLACGTCLNHYGLTEKLAVGTVSNMYEIATTMTSAAKVVRP